ncbi:MAG: hypothetical protein GX639_09785 [Fibrobacter sp.]|nr:hypothetical protein [Fibrobacter sp.]
MRLRSRITDDFDIEKFEWIDGERIALDEIDLKIENAIQRNASLFLFERNPDLNWIFGMDATE